MHEARIPRRLIVAIVLAVSWCIIGAIAYFWPTLVFAPIVGAIITLISILLFWFCLLNEMADDAEDHVPLPPFSNRTLRLQSSTILVVAAAISLIGAYSSQKLKKENPSESTFTATAFAELYGKPQVNWGIRRWNQWGVLYTGELVELARALLAIAIVQRVLLGPFRGDLRGHIRYVKIAFGKRGLKCGGFNWKHCTAVIMAAALVLLIPFWVISYSFWAVNAPRELDRLTLKNVQSRLVLANAIYDQGEEDRARKGIEDDIAAWFGKSVNTERPLESVIQELEARQFQCCPSSVPDRNFCVPYRWYSGFSLIMFAGCGIPFFLTPLLCLSGDLTKLQRDRRRFVRKSTKLLVNNHDSTGWPPLSQKLAPLLLDFKESIRFQAERYIEFPIWFVVFGAFELSVGRQTLAEDASKLTIWLVLIFLLFGVVVVHVGLVYERTFSWLRRQPGVDLKWLAEHSPLKVFTEFRETSILGLAYWFAGASIVFGILSQAFQLLGS